VNRPLHFWVKAITEYVAQHAGAEQRESAAT